MTVPLIIIYKQISFDKLQRFFIYQEKILDDGETRSVPSIIKISQQHIGCRPGNFIFFHCLSDRKMLFAVILLFMICYFLFFSLLGSRIHQKTWFFPAGFPIGEHFCHASYIVIPITGNLVHNVKAVIGFLHLK